MKFKDYLTGVEPITEGMDDIPTMAIDMMDDMLAALPEEERYSQRGEIFRYILMKLQE